MDFSPEVVSLFQARRGVRGCPMLWIEARNRNTGVVEGIGVWSGDDHRVFDIGGSSRTYYGAGVFMDHTVIESGVGMEVRQHRIALAPLRQEVRNITRFYDASDCIAEIHGCVINPETGMVVGQPVRIIKGRIQQISETLAAMNGESVVELTIASGGVELERGLPLYKSAAALKRRDPNAKGRDTIAFADKGVSWDVSGTV